MSWTRITTIKWHDWVKNIVILIGVHSSLYIQGLFLIPCASLVTALVRNQDQAHLIYAIKSQDIAKETRILFFTRSLSSFLLRKQASTAEKLHEQIAWWWHVFLPWFYPSYCLDTSGFLGIILGLSLWKSWKPICHNDQNGLKLLANFLPNFLLPVLELTVPIFLEAIQEATWLHDSQSMPRVCMKAW